MLVSAAFTAPRARGGRAPGGGARRHVRRASRSRSSRRTCSSSAARRSHSSSRAASTTPLLFALALGAGADRADDLEVEGSRRGAALRPGRAPPRRRRRRPGRRVGHVVVRPDGPPRLRHVEAEHVEPARVHLERARACSGSRSPARSRSRAARSRPPACSSAGCSATSSSRARPTSRRSSPGSYWRLIMPALPAFALLTRGDPAARPDASCGGWATRLAPLPGAARPGWRTTAAVVAVTGLVPIVVLVALATSRCGRATPPTASSSPTRSIVDDDRRSGRSRRRRPRRSRREGAATCSRWTDSTSRATDVLPRLPRLAVEGLLRHRSARSAAARTLRAARRDARHHARASLRRPDPPADAIYRIGVAANWLDDETRATSSRSARRRSAAAAP